MKKLKLIALALVLVFSANFLVSCYGNFALTRKVYEWNGSLGDKFINNLVFWGLCIIPVYEAAGFIDSCILNLIEFWTGTNPLAMNNGDKEIKVVKSGTKEYQITATKNRFEIKELKGVDAGKVINLVFHPNETAWYMENAQTSVKLVSMDNTGSSRIHVYMPNNQVVTMNSYVVHNVSDARTLLQMNLEVAAK